MSRGSVQDTRELRRVLEVPRRIWGPAEAAEVAARWSDALGRPPRSDCPETCVCGGSGHMALRPIQGVALSEIATWGGGLLPIRVGGGKTLISLLAARVRPSVQRPLLILPAHLSARKRGQEWRWLAALNRRREWFGNAILWVRDHPFRSMLDLALRWRYATLAIAFISVFLLIRRNRRKPPKQDEPREK